MRVRESAFNVCARLNFRCLNCQVRFWDSDLRTARFSHTSCSAIYRFLLWQSTRKLVDCQSKVEVFFFFFFKHWILKESKVRKWNSLQWGVLPAKEWGGVRILNYCRCALLKKKEKEKSSFIYFFSPWNVICSSPYPLASFVLDFSVK